jgi:hypothetical protein
MGIDPRLYEKLSGRSGDPYKRLGEALAQDAKSSYERRAQKDKSIAQRRLEAKFKAKWIASIIFAIVALIVVIAAAVR